MSIENNFLLPITVWGKGVPTHRISCISTNGEVLVSGSYDGQLCVWELDSLRVSLKARNIILGHKGAVTGLACSDTFVVSCSEDGQVCRWHLEDGYCMKTSFSPDYHKHIHLFKPSSQSEELIFCCGYYCDIFILNSTTLETVYLLSSKTGSDWISCFQTFHVNGNDVVTGLTVGGSFKLWMLQDLKESQYEVESIVLPVKNAVAMKCNATNTCFLVVASKQWQIFDAVSLKLKCAGGAEEGEAFQGGTFLKSGRTCVWTECGNVYLYDNCDVVLKFATKGLSGLMVHQLCGDIDVMVCGDLEGKVKLWRMNADGDVESLRTSLMEQWDKIPGMFEQLVEFSTVTSCLYIMGLDKFVIGCADGTVFCVPAMATIMAYYFPQKCYKPCYSIWSGHSGRVNCLLYPHAKYSHYNLNYVVSGGSDFSVCLWDVVKHVLVQRFTVQSGEILSLSLPPDNCQARVKHCICSVSADHSVALINLRERKCLMLASQHVFPIVSINWRPLEDFIIVECLDGSVYVWQIATGHLDRTLHGVSAQEVIHACSTGVPVKVCTTKHRGLMQVEGMASNSPLTAECFLTSYMTESHVLMFNIDQLMFNLNMILKQDNSVKMSGAVLNQKLFSLTQHVNMNITKRINTILERLKHEAEERLHLNTPGVDKKVIGKKPQTTQSVNDMRESTMSLTQVLLSLLHTWGRDSILDQAACSELGLLQPTVPACFALECRGVLTLSLNADKQGPRIGAICYIALKSLAQTLKNYSFTGEMKDYNTWGKIRFHLKQTPSIEVLAKHWQNKSLHVRDNIKTLIIKEINQLNEKQKHELLTSWYKYLPHFKSILTDLESIELKTIALVLFGVLGAETGFQFIENEAELSDVLHQTCNSFTYLLHLHQDQQVAYTEMQCTAVDLLGQGYLVWEPYLKLNSVLHSLLEMSADVYKICSLDLSNYLDSYIDRAMSAHNTLKTIAIARTNVFLSYLTHEISVGHEIIGKTKAEIILIFNILLDEIPSVVVDHLGEVVKIFLHCIDTSHLKQESIFDLIPSLVRYGQVDHCVQSQRVAIGLKSGDITLQELRSDRVQTIPAHSKPVTCLRFSPDMKLLATYSQVENKLSLWQLVTPMFGLGHLHVKLFKMYSTGDNPDPKQVTLQWADNKTVRLVVGGDATCFTL